MNTEFTREDFELAAASAGYSVRFSSDGTCYLDEPGYTGEWKPLEDDGQAFRLAVAANICVVFGSCLDDAPVLQCGPAHDRFNWQSWPQLANFPDSTTATRHAIFRAAVAEQKSRQSVAGA